MTDSHSIRSLPREDSDPYDTMSEDRYEMVPLARAALWAALAAFATFIAVIAARSDAGSQRLAVLLGKASPASVASASGRTPAETTAEILNLGDRVRLLETERDRLAARLSAVEKHLDVTASVPPKGEPTRPAVQAASQQGIANASTLSTQGEFGIDLGPVPDMAALRALWSTIRHQSGDLLDGLRPLAAIRDTSGGLELRLVAGPIANAGQIARVCAAIAAAGRACRASAFEGQRIALQ